MRLAWIPHLSPAYALCVALRRDILRKPLGLEFSEAQLAQEEDSLHLACFEGEVLVGTLLLTPRPEGTLQMRQVAVHEAHQGRGLGQSLVAESELEARRRGCTTMVLHARLSAVPFYEKLGYARVGEGFEEVGLPHLGMKKAL